MNWKNYCTSASRTPGAASFTEIELLDRGPLIPDSSCKFRIIRAPRQRTIIAGHEHAES